MLTVAANQTKVSLSVAKLVRLTSTIHMAFERKNSIDKSPVPFPADLIK